MGTCVTNGFCHYCNVIVGDYTCFCNGGPCPKCGNKIKGTSGTFPKNLHGLIQKYNTDGGLVCYYKYENGQCLGAVEKTSVPEETSLYTLIRENYSFYLNSTLVKHRFGFVSSNSDSDKWFYDFGHMNKDISFKDFCDAIFANGVRKGKLDKEREIKQALGIK
jgi:hypothetical protein